MKISIQDTDAKDNRGPEVYTCGGDTYVILHRYPSGLTNAVYINPFVVEPAWENVVEAVLLHKGWWPVTGKKIVIEF